MAPDEPDAPSELPPLTPPYPEIDPASSPDEAPQTSPVPQDDDSGRPHD